MAENPSEPFLYDLYASGVFCAECGMPWQVAWELWRAFLTDDEPPKVVFYCPACAEAEFG